MPGAIGCEIGNKEFQPMQTILKLMCGHRSQASMVDDYLVQFCAKAANETQSIEFPSPDAGDIAFARDDANEFWTNRAEKPRAQLGSFGQLPNQANGKIQLIFLNPMILAYQPNGNPLPHWVTSPFPGTAGNTESE
jgi:hypothetical protein